MGKLNSDLMAFRHNLDVKVEIKANASETFGFFTLQYTIYKCSKSKREATEIHSVLVIDSLFSHFCFAIQFSILIAV